MDDKEIIRLYQQRDQRAAAESAEKFGAYCRAIAGNMLADRRDVEEAVNETWLGAWNSIPPAEPKSLSAFLGGITRNISLNILRRDTRQKRTAISGQYDELSELLPGKVDVEDELDAKELAAAINDFLEHLPPEQRRVFVCRYWYFDSIEAIADRLGCSKGRVKSMLFRLRKKLHDRLQKEDLL